MKNRNRTLGAIALVAIVIASGCLTVSIDSTVNDDGTIDRYETRLEMPSMVLDQMSNQSQQEGMTLEESIKDGYDEEDYGSISVDVREEDGQGIIEIVLEDFDPAEIDGEDFGGDSGEQENQDPSEQASGPQIEVTVEEDKVTYVDDSFNSDDGVANDSEDDGFSGTFTLEYTLTMPGPVIEDETNADEIDGRTATWNESGSNVFSNTEIEAASERGSGGSFLGLPGFGAGLALVGLLLGAGLLTATRKRRGD